MDERVELKSKTDPDGRPVVNRGRRPRLAWAVAVLAACVLVAFLAGVKTLQIMGAIAFANSFPEPAEAVAAVVSEERLVTPEATAIGELQAKNVVDLRIERGGVVRKVNFASGETVEANSTLVEVDASEERADLAAAEVEARRAAIELTRQRRLSKEGVGAEVRLQTAEAEAAAARARVAALKTAVERKTVVAPFAGRVGITDLKPGQFVSEGDLIARIVGLDREIYVDFALPQAAATTFDPERAVSVEVAGAAVPASVIAAEPSIDVASRTLGFRAVIEDYDGRAPAGALVIVRAPIGAPSRTVVVPRTALVRSPYGDTVFRLIETDGEVRAKATLVTAGEPVGDGMVAILEGLEPGVRIAAEGVFKLRDGALVNPKPADGDGDQPSSNAAGGAPAGGDGP